MKFRSSGTTDDLKVIGSGPAGLAAEDELNSAGHKSVQSNLGRGCVFYAAGLGSQYIIQHRRLDMVMVVKDSGGQSSNEVIRAWNAIRPAVVAMATTFAGNETAFCRAYGANNHAPDLMLWEGGL